jgi:hypothetical protein
MSFAPQRLYIDEGFYWKGVILRIFTPLDTIPIELGSMLINDTMVDIRAL